MRFPTNLKSPASTLPVNICACREEGLLQRLLQRLLLIPFWAVLTAGSCPPPSGGFPLASVWFLPGGARWAKVNVEDVQKIMRYVVTHRHVAKRTGQQARSHILRHFSRDAIAQRVRDRLWAIQSSLSNASLHKLAAQQERPAGFRRGPDS